MTTKHDVHAAIATIELAFRIIGERSPGGVEPDIAQAVGEAFSTLRAFADGILGAPSVAQHCTQIKTRPA